MQEKNYLNEIIAVIIASLVIALIVALQIKWPVLSLDPFNFLLMFLLSLLLLGIFVAAQKITAFALDCKTKTKLLSFRRYWFRPLTEEGKAELSFDFPLWLFLPLILFFLTAGFLRWLAILDFDIEPRAERVRRKWKELSENEIGKVALVGPIAVLALGIIVKAIGIATASAGFNNFAILCVWLAFLSLLPFGTGFKLLNSSRLIWLFSLLLSFFILLLIHLSSVFAIVIIALLLALIVTIGYYMAYEKS